MLPWQGPSVVRVRSMSISGKAQQVLVGGLLVMGQHLALARPQWGRGRVWRSARVIASKIET